MSRKFYWILFFAGLLVAVAAASLERVPGYMDADYYYAGAQRLANAQGLAEPYLWNYLNDPAKLPAPGYSYWMPLVSLIASTGMIVASPAAAAVPGGLTGRLAFWAARVGFLLLAACIPPLTARLSFQLTGKPAHARLAGLLALFPGFYLAYLPTTDAFALYMVLGGLFMLIVSGSRPRQKSWEDHLLVLGLLAGLMHLTRADGLLWLGGAGLTALVWYWPRRRDLPRQQLLSDWAAVLGGYCLVMAFWYQRNQSAWGGLFPPGGGRALWITRYEETMIYPASLLTLQHWLAAGWAAHFRAWLDALGSNLGTLVAVQGGIVLIPFILAGMWQLRRCPPVRLGAVMWAITLTAMTIVFPFAGANGGFFHSGAALQPLLWALAPMGLESAAQGYARLRKLPDSQGMWKFIAALVVFTGVVLSGALYYQRVVGSSPQGGLAWESSARHYQQVEQELVRQGAQADEPVIVNNPPGYYLASGRPAVVVPFGDEAMLLSAARRYQARYLVLEVRNPWQLVDIYTLRSLPPELEYLAAVGDTRLYRINLIK